MASRNYLIMSDDMTLTDKKEYRQKALAAGLERCAIKGIGDIKSDIPALGDIPDSKKALRVNTIQGYIMSGAWPKSIDQRELAPLTDLVVPTALDMWLTAALAVIGTPYSCFQAVAAPQLIQDKLMVCYGISVESVGVPMPISRVIFRRGGAAGNIQAQFDAELLGTRLQPDAFFSEPVVIDPLDTFAIQVLCRNATGVAEIVHIHNFLFESTGLVIA